MKSLILRCCVVVGFGLLAISAANGQTQAIGPQPDIAPDAAAAPSPAQIIAEFDVDKDQHLDQQELENVLSLLFRQIQSLQREVRELKSQMAKESCSRNTQAARDQKSPSRPNRRRRLRWKILSAAIIRQVAWRAVLWRAVLSFQY